MLRLAGRMALSLCCVLVDFDNPTSRTVRAFEYSGCRGRAGGQACFAPGTKDRHRGPRETAPVQNTADVSGLPRRGYTLIDPRTHSLVFASRLAVSDRCRKNVQKGGGNSRPISLWLSLLIESQMREPDPRGIRLSILFMTCRLADLVDLAEPAGLHFENALGPQDRALVRKQMERMHVELVCRGPRCSGN